MRASQIREVAVPERRIDAMKGAGVPAVMRSDMAAVIIPPPISITFRSPRRSISAPPGRSVPACPMKSIAEKSAAWAGDAPRLSA